MPKDFFMRYEPIEKPEFKSSLLDNPIDMSDFALGYTPAGDLLMKESPAARQLRSRFNLGYDNWDGPDLYSPGLNSGVNVEGKQAVQFFVNKGVSLHASAAIVGNLIQESSMNPEAIGDNNTSIGLAQWHGPRGEKLKKYAKNAGVSWKDPNIQLEFLWHELNTDYKNVLQELNSSKTVNQATDIFLEKFEKPKNPNESRQARRNYANYLLS